MFVEEEGLAAADPSKGKGIEPGDAAAAGVGSKSRGPFFASAKYERVGVGVGVRIGHVI